jgi:hypothetical protein
MNPKRRWCRTGTVYVQQRDLSRETRKHTRSALASLCHDQARFRELRERLSNESGICVHAVCQGRRGDFRAGAVTQSSHDVRGNRELNASDGHQAPHRHMRCLTAQFGYKVFLTIISTGVPYSPNPQGLTTQRDAVHQSFRQVDATATN